MNRKRRPSDDDLEEDDDDLEMDFDDEDDDGEFDDGLDDDGLDDESEDQVTADRPLKSFSDRLVADYAADLKGPDVLVLLMHGTTLASALRKSRPELNFTFYTPEHFFFRTLQKYHGESAENVGAVDAATGKTSIVCSADLPEQSFDEVIFPTFSGDSSEQAQDLIQAAHQRLKSGGRLIISTNNPKDRWIQNQLKTLFSKVILNKQKHGVACVATRTAPLKKIRGFRARSAFRLGEQLVYCESRPGVFSHRRIDGGARALIKSLALLKPDGDAASSFQPVKIVEMGCGCGAVSMAAAIEFPQAKILAVDSDARAIECTQHSAALNNITTVDTLLTSDGVIPEPRSWDLLLGNPPYYSDYRIAELFLQAAKSALRTGGRIHLVTKLLDWHDARMKQLFNSVEAHTIGEYSVFTARQR
jgi:16S rRNA (guanine1207-N2)-methyltransferase